MAIKPIEILINARDNASGVFAKLDGKLKAMGVAIAGYFGVKAFAGIVNSAADFEEAMSKVQAATGASGEELAKLKQTAEDAGASTKYTAVESAGALETLAKAGLSASDAIAALPAVLELAQAGGIDLAQASEYMTKAVMGMGLSFDEAGRVADVLAKGANASNTSVTGLAQALSYVAPIANTLGVSLEGTVAIVGKFADAGIDASRAGTALNSIMSQFADPASKFRDELAAAGITTNDFEKALHELAAAGPAGSKAINAVGLEAGPALRALLNQGMGALDDLKQKLEDAAGSAKATAAVMSDNLNGAFKGLSSAWGTLTTVLGTPVLPMLTDAVNDLSRAFLNAIKDGTIQKFGEAIAAGFQSGIQWAREFLATIDFTKLSADLRAFADRTGEVFTQIGTYASNAGNIVQTAYGVMSAGVNTVMGGIYALGSGFATVLSGLQGGLAILMNGMAKLSFGDASKKFKEAADSINLSAKATESAAEELAKKSKAAFLAVANGAQMARDGFSNIASGADAAGAAVAAATPAIDAAAKALTGNASEVKKLADEYAKLAADGKLHDAAVKLTEIEAALASAGPSAAQHITTISKLRGEYDALMAAGNIAAADAKLRELDAALIKIAPALDVASKASAKHAAEVAVLRKEYDVLANSGSLIAAGDKLDAIIKTMKAGDPVAQAHVATITRLREEYALMVSTGQFDAARDKLKEISTALAGMAPSADAAAKGIDAVGKAMGPAAKAAEEHAAAIKKLREEYAAAVASGNWQAAAEAQVKLDAALSKSPAIAAAAATELNGVGKAAGDMVPSADAAAKAVDAVGKAMGPAAKAAEEHAAAVKKLREEYAAAVASGNWQAAAEAQVKLDAALSKSPAIAAAAATELKGVGKAAGDMGKEVAEAAQNLDRAFDKLGVTSTATLQKTAKEFTSAYSTIKNSATSTAEDVKAAFGAMAQSVIDGNKGVAPSWLVAEGAALGYKKAVDDTGKVSMKTNAEIEKSAQAHQKAAAATRDNRTELEKLNDEKERQISAQEKANQLLEREAELYRQKWKMDKEGYSVDANGKRIEATGQTQQSLYNSAKDAGLTAEQSKLLADEYAPKRTSNGFTQFNNDAFWKKLNQLKQQNDLDAEALQSEEKRMAEMRDRMDAAARGGASSTDKAPAQTPPAAPPPAAAKPAPAATPSQQERSGGGITPHNYISNITIPGVGSASLRFADADSQRQNETLLRQLVQAKGVAQ